jgi:hypothetical protein
MKRLTVRAVMLGHALLGMRHALRPAHFIVVTLVFSLIIAVIGFATNLPSTTVSVALLTETLEMVTVNPRQGRILLEHARVNDYGCVRNVVLSPGQGSRVYYSRPRHQALQIVISGDSLIEYTPAAQSNIKERRSERSTSIRAVIADAGTEKCEENMPVGVRLPVHGLVRYGTEFAPFSDATPSLQLLSGKVSVFSRATDSLVGIPLSVAPFVPNALYGTAPIEIPGGSVLEGADNSARGSTGDATPWYGFADVGFTTSDPGAIQVAASTNARRIKLHPPNPVANEERTGVQPDVIALSMVARLGGDPNLLWLYSVVACLAALATLADFLFAIAGRITPDEHQSTHAGNERAVLVGCCLNLSHLAVLRTGTGKYSSLGRRRPRARARPRVFR